MFLLWSALFVWAYTDASFCGTSGVPFSVEVLPSGSPVLGCAQPSCVAHSADDFDDSVFHTDGSGQIDGFFREGDKAQGHLQMNKLKANCSGNFDRLACTRKNQWVGGIEFINHPRQPLLLQCCTFEGLRFSQIVGVTSIRAGEAVTGGEVIRAGRQISFDVIANIRKVIDRDDPRMTSFEVTVRRMNCLSDPHELEADVDDDVEAELLRILEKANNGVAPLEHEAHGHVDIVTSTAVPDFQTVEKFRGSKKRKYRRLLKMSDRPESFGAPIFNPIEHVTRQPHFSRRTIPPPKMKTDVARTEVSTTTPTPPSPMFTLPSLHQPSPAIPPSTSLALLPGFPQRTIPSPPSSPMQSPFPGTSQAGLPSFSLPSIHEQINNFMRSHPLMPLFDSSSQKPPLDPNQEQNAKELQPFSQVSSQHHMQTGILQPSIVASPFYYPFGLPPQSQQIATSPMQQMMQPFRSADLSQTRTVQPNKGNSPEKVRLEDGSELVEVEPSLPPTQSQLGNLFQPPPFSSLHYALKHFQSQG